MFNKPAFQILMFIIPRISMCVRHESDETLCSKSSSWILFIRGTKRCVAGVIGPKWSVAASFWSAFNWSSKLFPQGSETCCLRLSLDVYGSFCTGVCCWRWWVKFPSIFFHLLILASFFYLMRMHLSGVVAVSFWWLFLGIWVYNMIIVTESLYQLWK